MSAVRKSKLRAEALGARIMPGDFQVNCVDIELTRRLLDELHGLASPPLTAITFQQKKLNYERIASEQFETVAKSQHDVSDDGLSRADEPDTDEGRVTQQAGQSRTRLFQFKRVMIERVIFTHQS
jgi:hypothetical protein